MKPILDKYFNFFRRLFPVNFLVIKKKEKIVFLYKLNRQNLLLETISDVDK